MVSPKLSPGAGPSDRRRPANRPSTRSRGLRETLKPAFWLPPGDTSRIANTVRVQQVATLFSRMPVIALGNLGMSALTGAVFWNTAPHAWIIVWATLIWAGALARLSSWWRNRRRQAPKQVRRRTIIRSALWSATTGCTWGFAGLLFFTADSVAHQVYLLGVIGGMAGCGAIWLSIIPSVSAAFFVPTLLPLAVRYGVQGDFISLALAAMLVAYTLALLTISQNNHFTFIKLVRTEHENAKLLAALDTERTRLEIRVAERTEQLQRVNRRLEADIEKRRQVENAIRESEEKFRDIAEVASDWFWETDDQHRFTFLSPRILEATGLKLPELLGKSRWELAGEEPTTPEWRQHLADLDDHRDFRNFRYTYVAPEGSVFYFAVSGKPVRGARGKFLGYRGTGTDVTAEIEAALSLATAAHAAEVANHAKSRFLANMSHELRTPLNAVVGFSDIMQKQVLGPLNERYAEYAKDIHDSGVHLLELINEILDFSKIEAGKFELQEDKVAIPEIVAAAERFFGQHFDEGEIRFETSLPRTLPMVHADGRALKQVLLNLLSNAIKFTPAGGRVKVAAKVEKDGPMRISVSDTGIGIAAADIERAMAAFEQIDEAHDTAHGGTGLGLAIARSLAELHGGSLSIASKVAAGTTVTIRLPAERLISSGVRLSA